MNSCHVNEESDIYLNDRLNKLPVSPVLAMDNKMKHTSVLPVYYVMLYYFVFN